MRHLVLVALLTTSVFADLTCPLAGVAGPAAELLCYFNHQKFRAIDNVVEEAAIAAEKRAVRDIENTVSSLEDAGSFLLTHHPAVLAYDFGKTAKSQGLSQATDQLADQADDILSVDVGVVKEAGNIAVGTANLAINTLSIHWRDAAFRTIKQFDAQQQVASKTLNTPTKRADQTESCLTEGFQALNKPATFTLQNPNQKVGGTLAQVFSLFVPLAGEEAGAGLAARNVFDLAIPGTEDVGRIYKQVAGKETQHFVGEEEALAVQGKLSDKAWTDANCVPCVGPLKWATTLARRRRNRLTRRADSLTGLRCNLPEGTPPGQDAEETLSVTDDSWDSDDSPLYSESPTRVIIERELVAPPALRVWGDAIVDRAGLIADMKWNSYTTANIAWEPDVVAAFPPQAPRASASQEIFSLLRVFFETESTELDDFRKWFGFDKDPDVPGRLQVNSIEWKAAPAGDVNAARMLAFEKATTTLALKIAKALKGITDAEIVEMLESNIDSY